MACPGCSTIQLFWILWFVSFQHPFYLSSSVHEQVHVVQSNLKEKQKNKQQYILKLGTCRLEQMLK